jgi:hypothetical protein
MSNNRNNLKNGLTLMYLSGVPNVYKIKSPNGQHFVLVNKNSLAKLLNRNNIEQLNTMISGRYPLIARRRNLRKNYASGHPYRPGDPLPPNTNKLINFILRNNYEFRRWNNTRGMIKPRGPYGVPIKLKNVSHHRLTQNNRRNLRALHLQNKKNAEEFARKRRQRK